MKKIITRELLSNQISKLLDDKLSVVEFGDEMFNYLAFDDEYSFEKGYESLIEQVLEHFSEMHDYGKQHVGYVPSIPSRNELVALKKKLIT